MTPPIILQFNASNVPVMQLTMKSKTMSEDKIYDYGLNFIRIRLFTVPGLATPAPFGGKTREIVVDVDPQKVAGKGLSVMDVVNAIQTSNLIEPAGTARMGNREYNIAMNSSPDVVGQFNDIPIKTVNGEVVQMGQVAKAYDGYADQLNVVRVDRKRAAYLTILKKSDASTLAVVEAAKDLIPSIQAEAPKGLELSADFDQSVFVKDAIESVLHEAITAAILVSIMILFFLGNWRSVIVVCTSIPLSILVSIIWLKLSGNTLNIMTLGGLSLAVGMLVDDATVEVENIERNRNLGRPLTIAILIGAQEIAVPALMATLAICIVFFPVVLLTGPSQYLFIPMALSVVVSMMASYVLSRTLVPVLSRMLFDGIRTHHEPVPDDANGFQRWSHGFNVWRDRGFDRFRDAYGRILHLFLRYRAIVLSLALLFLGVSLLLLKVVGTDFFPTVDAGMMKLHFRAPSGSRIEETERLVDSAEGRIQKIIPASELKTINDMIGVPVSYNLAFVATDNTGSMDAEILIALAPEHKPTIEYMRAIRKDLEKNFPGCVVYFQSADIVGQVLNFGLSAPIDIQIMDNNYDRAYAFASKLRDSVKTLPGAVDVTIKQVLDYPTFKFNVDRVRAGQLGLTQRDVANNMLVALSSSSIVDPSYFINPINNVNYTVAVKVPYQQLNSVSALMNTSVTNGNAPVASTVNPTPSALPASQSQTLRNLASVELENQYNLVSHYTVQRVIDITASVDGSDLGTLSDGIDKKIAEMGKPPLGMRIAVRGQPDVMHSSFSTLGLGLILSIILVYLLMVILFQSWLDPFIILFAVPGAFTGILWMLTFTHTTINVVSLMGSIVAVGIAVSNSILMVSFANEVRITKNLNAFDAALEAGRTRLRPVLMTAIAMILGMIPMALGTGAGGEQNAPLGRAVIGGLLFATVVTLFIVPLIYSVLRQSPPNRHSMDADFEAEIADMDKHLDNPGGMEHGH
jgi:multidrug efflux pump subunit AcrB